MKAINGYKQRCVFDSNVSILRDFSCKQSFNNCETWNELWIIVETERLLKFFQWGWNWIMQLTKYSRNPGNKVALLNCNHLSIAARFLLSFGYASEPEALFSTKYVAIFVLKSKNISIVRLSIQSNNCFTKDAINWYLNLTALTRLWLFQHLLGSYFSRYTNVLRCFQVKLNFFSIRVKTKNSKPRQQLWIPTVIE